ncbi:MAG TPA: TIM barrel protein [Opitutaceae bacterium]|nr:TIM barrel protein [Opitutaceae bacterium]
MTYLRAFSTLGCPELSLDEVFALAERHDIAGVELRALGGTLDLPAYFTQRFQTPAQAAPAGRAARTQILAFNTSFSLSDTSDSAREALLQIIPWAEALGVPRLRVFDGGHTGAVGELARAAATFRWWNALRQRHGWKTDLMVETHNSLLTAEAILRFLTLVPNAAILWDAHHTWRQGDEDPVATWRAIKRHVVHVHVKDSVGQPSARHPFTYVLPGTGEFPAAALLGQMRASGFSGPVSLEWEKLWHPYLPPLEDALAAANLARW